MANWGIFEFVRRAITLPAGHNTLSEILGPDVAKTVTGTVHSLLAEVTGQALTVLSGDVVHGTDHIVAVLTDAVTHTLSGVSPALATELNTAIKAAVGQAESVTQAEIAKLASEVLAEINKVLKL